MKKPKDSTADITVEPGTDERLAGMLKKVLNTPPKHATQPTPKPKADKRER